MSCLSKLCDHTGVPYNDQAVQDVLKADVATCVATQKQILVGCGFGMWVEEPDMDAACQVGNLKYYAWVVWVCYLS